MRIFSKVIIAISTIMLGICAVGCKVEENEGQSFVMKASVDSLDDRIEVTVIEAPYGNTGPFWVITSDETEFADANGNKIHREDIKQGDVVEITYGGQVMMSYPPQIAAIKIKVVG